MTARAPFGIRLRNLAVVAAAIALMLPAAPSLAQQHYPSRPVKVIVPFPPGGSFDAVARIVMQDISDARGWTYAIENRAGADGQIGVVAAARSDPDGYTLLAMTSITHGSAPALKQSLGYDPVADIAPIVLLGEAPLVLLVKKEVPAASLAELVRLMRTEPGKLAITSAARSPRLPDVPTMAETGFPGVEIAPWVGLGVPAHTPREIIDKWAEAANIALSRPSVRERIAAVDYEPRGGTPEDLARFSAADIARYRKLVAQLQLTRK